MRNQFRLQKTLKNIRESYRCVSLIRVDYKFFTEFEFSKILQSIFYLPKIHWLRIVFANQMRLKSAVRFESAANGIHPKKWCALQHAEDW